MALDIYDDLSFVLQQSLSPIKLDTKRQEKKLQSEEILVSVLAWIVSSIISYVVYVISL